MIVLILVLSSKKKVLCQYEAGQISRKLHGVNKMLIKNIYDRAAAAGIFELGLDTFFFCYLRARPFFVAQPADMLDISSLLAGGGGIFL